MKKYSRSQRAFTLLEIMPVVSIAAVLVLVATFALRPVINFQRSRNQVRLANLGLIGDAIADHARDTEGSIVGLIPRAPDSIEICSDVRTGSCTSLLSLSPLIGEYLHTIPRDPRVADDNDNPPEHSGYFIEITTEGRFRLFAPESEPDDSAPQEVTR